MNREKYRKLLIVIFAIYLCTFIYYLSYTIYAPKSNESFARIQPSEKMVMQTASNMDEKKLMPLGIPVGIYIRAKGVMVLETGEVTDAWGNHLEPAKGVLERGDYLLEMNGKKIQSIEKLQEILHENGENTVELTILRNNQLQYVETTPVKIQDAEYKIGVWLRQDAQGIGTLTYVDEDGNFAALGHGVTDVDTSDIIDIQNGRLYESTILSIVKGKNGKPGEMIGNIDYQNSPVLGTITENNARGIYGSLSENYALYDEAKALPVGNKKDVKKGKAFIRCCMDGVVQDYAIEIENVQLINPMGDKDLIIRITDEKLLKKTNGIIQGMSGSPIIQDGKLVGAVTHVLVNDPTRGYGIFIESMLEH